MSSTRLFLLACNDGLTKSFPWYEEGVRALPFARAILGKFDLL